MAGYIRQSTFVDGDTITAALFNNEYNQLVNAFSNTSGHKHDGTTAEGPVIGLIGDAGETSPNNKVLIDTTNNYIEFYVEVSSAPVQQLYIADGAIIPVTDSDIDLGTTSLRFKDTYTDTVTTTGNVSIGGDLTVTGSATISGNLTFGDADTDSINLAAEIDSDIIPNTDGTYDLGSATKEWQDLYIDGTANIDSLVADTADINGGTIDGATIATSDITVGAGKTLDVSAGTLTLADDQISGDKVEGGTIAATTITTLTSTTGNITNVNATTLDTTNIEVTNLKAKDGTSAGSIADSTGVVTLGSSVLTTTDINGGTIDGVTIGGTTAGAVTFTDLSDGTITIAGFADEDNMSSDSATLIPTQQSVKAYVDSQVTAQDLDFQGDTGGALSIDLDSESLTIAGGTGIDTSGATNTLTVAIDSTVATLTGTQTLTNKTLTSPDVNTPDIDGGTIDSTVIGGATPAAGTFTTLTANSGITGTLQTAAQANITSVGTLSSLSVGSTITIDNTDASSFGAVEISGTSGAFIDLKSPSSDDFDLRIITTGTGGQINAAAGTLALQIAGSSVLSTSSSGVAVTGTLSATGNITGTLATAAQPNITSLGTLTALTGGTGDLNWDSGTLFVDSSANAIGIGTTSPDAKLHVKDASAANDNFDLHIESFRPNLVFEDASTSATSFQLFVDLNRLDFLYGDASTDTKLVNNAMTINSSGNVGIGTTSPSYKLEVYKAGFNAAQISGDSTSETQLRFNGNTAARIHNESNTALIIATNASEVARFDNSGNFGIGTTSPSAPLDVAGNFIFKSPTNTLYGNFDTTTAGYGAFRLQNQGSNYGFIGQTSSLLASGGSNTALGLRSENEFAIATGGSTERMRIDSSGNVGIGTTSPTEKLDVNGGTVIKGSLTNGSGTGSALRMQHSSNISEILSLEPGVAWRELRLNASQQTFYIAGGEKMRIDSSGNLLVGKTNNALANDGVVIREGGEILATNTSDLSANFNRLSTDGGIVGFYKDGSTVGSIGAYSGDFWIGQGNTGLLFDDGSDILRPANASGGNRDGNYDLGTSSSRFKDLYLSGKTYLNTTSGAELILQTDATRGFVGTSTSHDLILETGGSERMRIDSSGNLLVGTTSQINSSTFSFDSGSSRGGIFENSATAAHTLQVQNTNASYADLGGGMLYINQSGGASVTGFRAISVYANSIARFAVRGDGTIFSQNTTVQSISDERFKENVKNLETGLSEVMNLKPRRFDWKEGRGTNQKNVAGFIAQEIETVLPDLVDEFKDGLEDNEMYKTVGYTGLIPTLVKAIQEQQAQIEALQSEINELKNS